MLKVKISEVPALVELCRKSKNNLLVVGDPGVGKSQTIGGLANDHCRVTMLTGSSTYEETVNGIPRDNKETNVQDYTRPQWFVNMLEWSEKHKDSEDYQVLFIDEFNTADPQVLKTFLSILTERKIPTQPEPLPEDVVLVAAMNPASENEGEELIRPMASRFITVEVRSTLETYRDFITGEPSTDREFNTLDDPIELDKGRISGYLDQIPALDWQNFSAENPYHEICPRSMTNFFRAMSYVPEADRKAVSPDLAAAFFGKAFRYPDDIAEQERKAEVRKEKVKKGFVAPTMDELKEMTTAALRDLNIKMLSKGSSGTTTVANIIQVLAERGESI